MHVSVQGGTRAGWRKVLPAYAAKFWSCPGCGARLKYHWLRCPTCSHPRPDAE